MQETIDSPQLLRLTDLSEPLKSPKIKNISDHNNFVIHIEGIENADNKINEDQVNNKIDNTDNISEKTNVSNNNNTDDGYIDKKKVIYTIEESLPNIPADKSNTPDMKNAMECVYTNIFSKKITHINKKFSGDMFV